MFFGGWHFLHPSARLLLCLAAMVAAQFLSPPGLCLMAAGGLLGVRGAWRRWLIFLQRSRWLLLVLWLVVAFNTPGEAWLEAVWLPAYEGMVEANVNVLRLVVILGCLSALFASLGTGGLPGALWGILMPLQRRGIDCRALLVRLSLVLAELGEGQWRKPDVDWRQMLQAARGAEQPGRMQLVLESWRVSDVLYLLLGCSLLLGVCVW